MIEPGDTVTVHYALWLQAGQVVESTFDADPAVFEFGRGEFLQTLERRLESLETGQDAEFIVSAGEGAFGAYDPGNRHVVARTSFDAAQCRQGALVEFELPGGERVSGRIESIDGDDVLVDFNHPLAGRDVHCRLQLVSVQKSGQTT